MIQTSYQLDHASSGFHPKLTGSYSLMINVLEVLAANTGVNMSRYSGINWKFRKTFSLTPIFSVCSILQQPFLSSILESCLALILLILRPMVNHLLTCSHYVLNFPRYTQHNGSCMHVCMPSSPVQVCTQLIKKGSILQMCHTMDFIYMMKTIVWGQSGLELNLKKIWDRQWTVLSHIWFKANKITFISNIGTVT